jgi:cbb3-type cytochrome oxidase maturation protein
MEIIFMLIGISLIVALVFLVFFLRSIRSGQFDDMHTPSVRILFENTLKIETDTTNGKSGNNETGIGS